MNKCLQDFLGVTMGERVSAIADLFHQQKFSRLMKQIKSDNAQGKYNLTDVFDFFSQNNFSMESLGVSSFDEIRGVNTKVQLEEMERMYLEIKIIT